MEFDIVLTTEDKGFAIIFPVSWPWLSQVPLLEYEPQR
jgi:hypothetical protein